jgi:myo-inositol-1(or 4)-monophosphatase
MNNTHNWKDLCLQTIELVRPTVEFIRQERATFSTDKIEMKGLNDLVSYVDKTAEQQLIAALSPLVPGVAYIAEESFYQKQLPEKLPDQGSFWIIDPLDGTTNFIHGLPVFAVSVALYVDGALRLGVVWEVTSNECFYAWQGGGAWLNGKKVNVSAFQDLGKSLLATGFPYYDFGRMDDYLQIIHNLMKKSHGLRRMGSAAVDLAFVACGRFEGFFEYNLKPWDVAAGALLVIEAGGLVTDFEGNDNFLMGNQIVAGGRSHAMLLQEIKQVWYEHT